MSEKELKNPEELLNQLNQKVFPVKLTGATKRSISHWLDTGLIPDDRKGDGKDRYFTYVEFFWVSIIIELRELGVPNAIVKKVNDYMQSPLSSEFVNRELTTIEEAILTMIVSEAPLFLQVSKEGDAKIYNDQALHYDVENGFYTTYATIRLNRLFKAKIKNIRFNTYFTGYLRLTEGEEKVLDALYDEETESIKVIKRKGEIEMIELEQNVLIDKKIIEILKDQKYQNIEIKQHDGKVTKIKRTVKKRVRSDYKKKGDTANKIKGYNDKNSLKGLKKSE